MARKIVVVPFNNDWARLYDIEKEILIKIFGNLILDIQHFGSTSIIGMSAKPTIDVMIVVDTIEAVDAYNEEMIAQGFSIRGESGIPGRRFFVRLKGDGENHATHVHIYEKGNFHIYDELMFRDFLALDRESFEKYEKIKVEAADKFKYSPDEYVEAKSNCVMEIMEKAKRYYSEKSHYNERSRTQHGIWVTKCGELDIGVNCVDTPRCEH